MELADPRCLTVAEKHELLQVLSKFNFVIYQSRSLPLDKTGLRRLCAQLGIDRTDHTTCESDDISSLQVCEQGARPRYIPYTDRRLGWHTDGYYYGTGSGRTIRSFILHCDTPAPEGGTSSLLDPDVVFRLLSDIDSSLPVILSDPAAFSIPPDTAQPREKQLSRAGPVFSTDPASGALHMRYTARRHNIQWNTDPNIRAAARCLQDVIENASKYTVEHKLEAGQGVICNNVLHRRSGFVDGDSPATRRLMYRARFYGRIPGTCPDGRLEGVAAQW